MRKISVTKSVCAALFAVVAVGIAVVMADKPYGYIPADPTETAGARGDGQSFLW